MPADLPYVADEEILRLVGQAAAARGKERAREGAVSDLAWSAESDAGSISILEGSVRGSRPVPYQVTVVLREGRTVASLGQAAQRPSHASCTCPASSDCTHVAAVLYESTTQAMRSALGPGASAAGRSRPRTPAAPEAPDWRRTLGSLLGAGEDEETPRPALAIGVELLTGFGGFGFSRFGAQSAALADLRSGAEVTVALRPLRQGASGTWVRGSLTWSAFRFASLELPYREDHAALLSQLVRTFLAQAPFAREPGNVLRLDEFAGTEAWELLARAARLGMPLVGQGIVGEVQLAEPADLRLHVERDGEDVLLRAQAGTPTETVAEAAPADARLLPLGAGGFARLTPPAASDSPQSSTARTRVPLTLLPLRTPVPGELRELVRSGTALRVPAADADELLADVLPLLAPRVQVTSEDAALAPTAAPAPRLQLQVEHEGTDTVRLDWSWLYRAPRRVLPLTRRPSPRQAGRDSAHEQQVLTAVDALATPLGDLTPEAPSADLTRRTVLRGVEAAAFCEHVLPRLATLADVDVLETGDRPDFTELPGAPHLRITQVEPPNHHAHDWFDLGFEITLGQHLVPFTAVFSALSQGKKAVLLPDKTYFRLDHPSFDRLRELIDEAQAMAEWEPGAPSIGRYQVALWEEFEDLADESVAARAWRDSVGALRDLQEIPSPAAPAGLRATLRPYQAEGYAWLSFLADHQLGGILADDMGLGKTLQALAAITRLREQDPHAPPVLIVAPSSVLSVWRREAERFCPDLDVRVLDTTAAKRGTPLLQATAGADAVVTSYTLMRLDAEEHTAADWQGLVLDEAQAVKNPRARAHRVAAEIRAPFRLAITGTPLENSLTDLWALLALTAPGLFPSPRAFREEYVRPIETPDASDSGQARTAQRMARLRRRIRPFVMRRTKNVVAPELPPKQEQVLRVPLVPAHRRLYERILQRERQKLLGLAGDIDRHRFIVFRSLTLLRMLALDPAIVDPEHAEVPSSKLDVVIEHLTEVVAEGHRALVFSQFTSHLGHVSERLGEAGIAHTMLDGSTRGREAVVDEFREGAAPVFLISLKAGGFGLTLTEADYVYLLDPWWNPAAENQAIDRAHRIGQDRSVMVYRMVAEDTIEEKVLALQERKRDLFAGLTDDEQAFTAALTAEDVRELLS